MGPTDAPRRGGIQAAIRATALNRVTAAALLSNRLFHLEEHPLQDRVMQNAGWPITVPAAMRQWPDGTLE